jgi:hypothetical protein
MFDWTLWLLRKSHGFDGPALRSGGLKIRKGDQLDLGEFFQDLERATFHIARTPKPRADSGKIGIVISGVGDQLPGA